MSEDCVRLSPPQSSNTQSLPIIASYTERQGNGGHPLPRANTGRSDRALPLSVFPPAGELWNTERRAEVQHHVADKDYLTNFASWLAVQNRQGPFPVNDISPTTTYFKNGRDLGAWDHVDFAYQAYLFAVQWLQGNKAPLKKGNPYLKIANQAGVQTFGPQHILDLLGEVSNRALKAMWYQRWFVHRALRPLAYGGLVHNTITGVAKCPVHSDVLNSLSNRSDLRKAPGLVPLAGCLPRRESPASVIRRGHGVIAGACVTALKAFFDESFVIPKPVVASDDGQSSLAYNGPDAGKMKVGGELNKLADNVA